MSATVPGSTQCCKEVRRSAVGLALSKHGPPDLPRSPNPPTGPATGDVTDPLTLMEVGPVSFEEIDPTTGGVGNTGPPAAA